MYLSFNQEEHLFPPPEDYQDPNVNTDFATNIRFSPEWQIGEIMYLPDQNSFADHYFINRQEGIFSGG